jgi:hypothetical protein
MTTGSGVTWWRVRRGALLACLGSRDSAYVYDLATVRAQVAAFGALRSISQVLYALKANPHPEILRTVHAAGCGFECVSRAEVERVLAEVPRVARECVLFTPNFAPRAEYAWALERGLRVTVDNLSVLREWPALFKVTTRRSAPAACIRNSESRPKSSPTCPTQLPRQVLASSACTRMAAAEISTSRDGSARRGYLHWKRRVIRT